MSSEAATDVYNIHMDMDMHIHVCIHHGTTSRLKKGQLVTLKPPHSVNTQCTHMYIGPFNTHMYMYMYIGPLYLVHADLVSQAGHITFSLSFLAQEKYGWLVRLMLVMV